MRNSLNVIADIKVRVKFNSGMNEKLINMNTTFEELGGEIVSRIMFFHCFFGFQSTTAFFFNIKNVPIKAWNSDPNNNI